MVPSYVIFRKIHLKKDTSELRIRSLHLRAWEIETYITLGGAVGTLSAAKWPKFLGILELFIGFHT